MSRNQQHLSDVPDTGKLIDDDKRADSGFISSEGVIFSGEISEEISEEIHIPEQQHSYHRSDPRSQSDSGIIEDNENTSSGPMHIDSGICLRSESLSDNFAKINLDMNDLNNPKRDPKVPPIQTPVESKNDLGDIPWNIYYEQDEDGDTHLHTAIIEGFAEVALALIRAAPHPRLLDTPNDAAETPLHLAIQTEQFQVARWLIVAGAKPCPRDSQGNSPLHLAAGMGDLNCVRAITEPINPKHRDAMALGYPLMPYEKPKLDQWNYLGQTCVHIAARRGHLEVLKHLVYCGADINAREGLEGITALHYAVQESNEKMVKFLLNECKHLIPNATTYGGRNAWQWRIIVPEAIKEILKIKGLDSPYTTEDEDSSEEEDSGEDEEVTYDSQVPRFTPNLVNASA